MLEGLIDFTSKFSLEPLNSIVMKNITWGFFECEPNIWIIGGFDNSSSIIDISNTNKDGNSNNSLILHRPNPKGIISILETFYKLFYTFNGSIHNLIQGTNFSGWEKIQLVAASRKTIRKMKIALRQQSQDLNYLQQKTEKKNLLGETDEKEDFSLSIHIDHKSLEEVKSEISISKKEIVSKENSLRILLFEKKKICGENDEINVEKIEENEENDDDEYSPHKVRRLVGRLMRHFIISGRFLNPSALNGLCGGARMCPPIEGGVTPLLILRKKIENCFDQLVAGRFLFIFILFLYDVFY
jgi:hypothetical protein